MRSGLMTAMPRTAPAGQSRDDRQHSRQRATLFHQRLWQAVAHAVHVYAGRHEEFFLAIGTPLASRTDHAPALSATDQQAFLDRANALAATYGVELIHP
jgi:predicted Ser/Thr protein kinase